MIKFFPVIVFRNLTVISVSGFLQKWFVIKKD